MYPELLQEGYLEQHKRLSISELQSGKGPTFLQCLLG